MLTSVVLLVLAALGAAQAAAQAAGAPSDADLLLAVKATFENGDTVLAGWRNGTDVCSWRYVSCGANNRPDSIQIDELGLIGQIPQESGWVFPNSTTELKLGKNRISGPIPPGWQLHEGLKSLYLSNNSVGGTFPADWLLPSTLENLILENVSLAGPLPTGWRWPARLASFNLMTNQLMGAIPASFAGSPSLQILNLDHNRLTGSIPVFTFDATRQFYGLTATNNNFSGTVPAWPDAPKAVLGIFPGSPDVCGALPTPAPTLYDGTALVTQLPPCNSSASSSGGSSDGGSGLSTGAIVGAVVGSVAGAAVLAAAALCLVQRQRQRRQQLAAAAGKAGSQKGSDMEAPPDGASPQLSKFPSSGAASTATPASLFKFNPFQLGGSGGSGDPTSTLAAFPSSSTGLGSGQRVPLTAAASLLHAGSGRPGSSSSNASPHAASLAARLESLQREPPAWLIDPNRLMLELTGDGRLVLLGMGHHGACYRGWLLPQPAAAAASESVAVAAAGAESPPPASQAVAGGVLATTIGSTEVRVAIKVLNIADMDAAFFKEADILHRLGGSPHVVALHGACLMGEHMVVVMELMQGGDLAGALASDGSGELSWGRRGRDVALGIAEGLAFLHANNVTHRDLKSQNVLLTRTLQAKVADVGGATVHSHTYVPEGASDFRGTLAYAAPELLLAAPCTNKIDSFSFGIVLWEIVTHEVPRRGFVQPPPPSDACPAGVSHLIRDCLQTDPHQRPSSAQLVERLRAL